MENKIDWYNEIVERLKVEDRKNLWTDGDDIFCGNEEQAEYLANFIETMYKAQGEEVVVITGSFNPNDGVTDDYPDIWYVTID